MAERLRTPISVRSTTLAWTPGEPITRDLLASIEPQAAEPVHPDFSARAAIWKDHRAGLISFAEAQRRSAAIGAPPTAPPRLLPPSQKLSGAPRKPKETRPLAQRPSPNDSRQYTPAMATTAARDDRLTPNAKALLQVLRARCGKTRETTITTGTAGNIMSRSTRTIRRYLTQLVRWGYVETKVRMNRNGMHIGLTIIVTDLVAPFYESAKGLARWLAEMPSAALRPFTSVVAGKQGRTLMSSKNQTPISSLMEKADTSRFASRGRLGSEDGGGFRPFGR